MNEQLQHLLLGAAAKIDAIEPQVHQWPVLLGFDGFVDEVIRPVDKRESAEAYSTITTIEAFAQRLKAAAGQSTNIELVRERTKLGGNGPIMGFALASFGMQLTYIGNLGQPEIHPIFRPLAARAKVFSLAEPGRTDALEFDDGKIMLGKYAGLYEISFERIVEVVGEARFMQLWQDSRLVGLLNWTMIHGMTDIWRQILQRLPHEQMEGTGKILFIDLADPEKRLDADLLEALDVLSKIACHYRVVLACNEKESQTIARILGLPAESRQADALLERAGQIQERFGFAIVVIHPLAGAVAASSDSRAGIDGPFTPHPRISTGGGDHFNAGFALGSLMGVDLTTALALGVATSGYYVRTAESPGLRRLAAFLRQWAEEKLGSDDGPGE